MSALIARHPVAAYFVCAYAISWALWLPRVAFVQGWWDVVVPEWWHYLGALGPASAALLIATTSEGRAGASRLGRQFSPGLIRPGWLAFAAATVLVPFACALAYLAVRGTVPPYAAFARANNLPEIGLVATFAVHTLTFGIGEETGWRAYALPRLQDRHGALTATAYLFVGWAGWHLPTFYENPSFVAMSAGTVAGWLGGLALGAVFLTWLYNSTDGGMLTVVAWHGLFNTVTASMATPGVIAAVTSTAVMLLAVATLAIAGPQELSGFRRVGGRRIVWSGLE
ncbi:MAG: CPBP family intramembrane metalloprotease [Dehalococcoidia bacterium]|nr:CPBP family intramembrane metalloprotease [Dehalococcoidia bacterium]